MKNQKDDASVAHQNMLTFAETARELRCSEAWLRRLLAGKIPDTPPLLFIRLGGKRLCRRELLQDWLLLLEQRERETQYASGRFAGGLTGIDPEFFAGA